MIAPFFVLLVAAGLIMTLLVVRRRRRNQRVFPFPACGGCYYDVTGLTTRTCPECGADLDEVGVLEPGRAAPSPWWQLAIIFGAVLVIPILISYIALDRYLPKYATATTTVTLTTVDDKDTPVSTVTLVSEDEGWETKDLSWTPTDGVRRIKGKPAGSPLVIDMDEGEVRWDEQTRRFSADAFAAWLQSTAPEMSDEDALEAGDQIVRTLDEGLAQNPMVTYGSGRLSATWTGNDPHAAFQQTVFNRSLTLRHWIGLKPLFITFWALVWLAAAYLIRKGRPTVARP